MRIYLADLTHTGAGINSDTFPLGIGLLASYAIQTYGKEIDITLHKLPEDLISSLSTSIPDIVGFSSYNWNSTLSIEIAKNIKNQYPKVVVIFGGPNFPLMESERKIFLKKNQCIDFYIKFDGEYAFSRLIGELNKVDFDIDRVKTNIKIDNVCYVRKDDTYIEGPNQRIQDLDNIKSPYTTGLMDKFFELDIMPLIETTRGCPFSCTFCTDGNPVRSKIKKKSEKYIEEELDYIANKVKPNLSLISADLNFGSYIHDVQTAKTIRRLYKKYMWPQRIIVSSGKTRPERMMEASNIINNSGKENLDIIQMGSSLQSLNNVTLKRIKRKNLSKEKLAEIHKLNNDSQNFTELIIPLPGETLKSFYDGLIEVVDSIEFDSIAIHNLTLLEGSVLATNNSREENKFNTRFRVFVGCFGKYKIGKYYRTIAEIEETPVSTDSMTYDDYMKIRVMTLLVKIFIDGETYKPILGQIAQLGIGKVDVLIEILDNTTKEFPEFENIINSYIAAIESKFFVDKNRLEESINKLSMKELSSGYLVNNELLASRALAYKYHFDDCDQVLKRALISILESKNKEHDVEQLAYVDNAFTFVKARRYDFNDVSQREIIFRYDFIYAESIGFNACVEELRKETKISFFYSDRDIKLFQDYNKLYGNDLLSEVGKFIQKINWTRTQRKISYA